MRSFITEAMIRAEYEAEQAALMTETDRILATMQAQLMGFDVPDADVILDLDYACS